MKHILSKFSRSSLTGTSINDCQPNACDLRVNRVFRILDDDFLLYEDSKSHRGKRELFASEDKSGHQSFHLTPGSYEVTMLNNITVGTNEAGWVVTRSTLNRNGIFITSGLYDSGYHGVMAACLHVTCGHAYIEKFARIGQYLCFDAEMLHEYDGSYGFDKDGKPKKEELAYHNI